MARPARPRRALAAGPRDARAAGDGLFDLPRWLAAGVPLSLGSDSHATRDWREELRLLEYGQRLVLRRRNVAAAPELGQASTAERLFARMVSGSAAASGCAAWGLVAGARADALLVDPNDDSLLGVDPHRSLDALVFSSPSASWRDVMVAGRWVLRDGRHAGAAAIADRYSTSIGALTP
jgi:formimidoylglutamate deiminase